jgi:hypothetical protein
LLELRQSGGRRDYGAAEPERYPQTEATAIGNHHEIFDLINKTLAAFAVAVQGLVNFFDVTPNQGELGLYGVGHIPIIRRRHEPPQIARLPEGRPHREFRQTFY